MKDNINSLMLYRSLHKRYFLFVSLFLFSLLLVFVCVAYVVNAAHRFQVNWHRPETCKTRAYFLYKTILFPSLCGAILATLLSSLFRSSLAAVLLSIIFCAFFRIVIVRTVYVLNALSTTDQKIFETCEHITRSNDRTNYRPFDNRSIQRSL